ncbi:MAG: acyltransferase [Bacteroidales bacterium]|nr:acyltransferase [Bacteroidales bacterium]MDD4655778.1 acyltransferase [Bacteroidales bacterium]
MFKNSEWLLDRPKVKQFLVHILINPVRTRPRLWLRVLQPFYIKKGRKSHICKRVRKDVIPYNKFHLGARSVIEDFSVVNNMVGNVIIGNNSKIGIGNTIIGPVAVGHNVIIAQNVTISALNHLYKDISTPIVFQGIIKDQIKISNNVWIGANVVITMGVTIGEHCVIAAGSVVVRDIPDFSVAVGNPAKVIKTYNKLTNRWESV